MNLPVFPPEGLLDHEKPFVMMGQTRRALELYAKNFSDRTYRIFDRTIRAGGAKIQVYVLLMKRKKK